MTCCVKPVNVSGFMPSYLLLSSGADLTLKNSLLAYRIPKHHLKWPQCTSSVVSCL